MEINQLKIELIQEIIACEDEQLLQEIEQVLDGNISEVREKEEEYPAEVEKNLVPDWYYQTLEEDYEKYKRGELPTSSWNDVKKKLQEKYDF